MDFVGFFNEFEQTQASMTQTCMNLTVKKHVFPGNLLTVSSKNGDISED